MDFHDFPRFLGKSGCVSHPPPKLCAYLAHYFVEVLLNITTAIVVENTFSAASKDSQMIQKHTEYKQQIQAPGSGVLGSV